jgi:hypothetical protein
MFLAFGRFLPMRVKADRTAPILKAVEARASTKTRANRPAFKNPYPQID